MISPADHSIYSLLGEPFGPSSCCMRSCEPWLLLVFRSSVPLKRTSLARLLRPLLTSGPRSIRLAANPVSGRKPRTRPRSPRLSLTTFVTHPPDLQPRPSMERGLRRLLPVCPTAVAYYPISVRRVVTLLHTAFRRHLTTTPLRFASPSPPSGWTRDLHPQAEKHARHTKKMHRGVRCMESAKKRR